MYLFQANRKWLSSIAALALAAAFSVPVQAATDAEAPIVKESKWPQATLNAEASATVAQDTVKITLATELTDASQTKVTAALGKTLSSVMEQAKADPKVKARNGSYNLYPFTDKSGKITSWRGRGEIILESTDFDAASQLANKLSDRMPIAGLAFSVSADARAKAEQALLSEAVKAFQVRAQALTDAFDFASYAVRSVELGGSGAQPYQPAPRMMAMAADKAAAVPLEGGTERITLSVHGSIFLHGKK
ncbi:SIMPL domain-containing protein [Eoetvoesiella caeni]|uniref:Putative secreted protein n=1 Tax=Eoetvoesiella caeni TaxID=645616 RepID=A0A366HE23_9BURK|nr:SIMPL domain-containing protein [Eoetvoesiella caeni]MCI2809139.1 SIMPL domain-containing protein [Eoetvoesiella caeni]NYT55360.1 SIMPL domain-containing protein [Eoetvoesiella caeni]RBP39911.1 putative secreted protein [Eoetvoesiella caeni]